jgi:RNA polymerase sigma-70 factor (ECF subfamily)
VVSDAALIARVARGERAALADLYDRHAQSAYSLAARLVGASAAEDIVHDAFVALVDKPELFDPARGSFRGWFLTVVHHRALNHLRRARASADERALTELPDADPEPPDAIIQQLQDETVRDALGRLNADQRDVLVLAYYGGLSQTALATRLGLPLGTVKARMRRGLIALRGLLGDAVEPDERGRREAT